MSNSTPDGYRASIASLHRFAMIVLALAAVAIAGCGGSEDGQESSSTVSSAPVKPVNEAAVGQLKPRMSRSAALKLLGDEPVLTQGPTETFPKGCIFYPMNDQPLANLEQICFNNEGLSVILTALSPQQPAPPEGLSPTHEALLGRGDSVCQTQYGYLGAITNDVANALQAFEKKPSQANRAHVVRHIGRFIDNLDDTKAQLAAFDAPDDGAETLTSYLDSLQAQAGVLREARSAFQEGDMKAYDQLGAKFTEIGKTAMQEAKDYGFSTCSASNWG